MHFTRHGAAAPPIIVRGEGCRIVDAEGRSYLDGLAGLFTVQVGHGRRELAQVAARQAEELAFFPLWSYAHPSAIDLAERLAHYAPGDLDRVFFTSGGGEAVESAWKLAKQYFKLIGKPYEDQGDQPLDRLPRHPAGRARDHRGLRVPRAVRAAGARRLQGAQHQRLPRAARPGGEGVRAVGGRPRRGGDPRRGRRHGGRGVRRARAERGRLLPAAARLLRAAARDLHAPRRAAGLRRGDLRVRPHRLDVRLLRLRLRPGHHHLRQGHDLGLLADRRDDRQRSAVRAVRQRHGVVPARLHVRRAPGVGRRGDGQPGHLRAGGAQRARPGAVAGRSARRWSSCWTCRSSATCAARASSSASSW